MLLLTVMGVSLLYYENPPAAHTGGFGEPTCHACHFDGDLNDGQGALFIEGLQGPLVGGREYPLKVVITKPGLERAGFQLSSRFEDGTQAGILSGQDELVAIDVANKIQYIRHTPDGTEAMVEDSLRWEVLWRAPDEAKTVLFHLAANASNRDESEFGDAIYQKEFSVEVGR